MGLQVRVRVRVLAVDCQSHPLCGRYRHSSSCCICVLPRRTGIPRALATRRSLNDLREGGDLVARVGSLEAVVRDQRALILGMQDRLRVVEVSTVP